MSTAPLEPIRFAPIAPEDLTPEQQAVMNLYRSGWQAQLTDLPKHHWMTLRSPKFAAVVTPVSNYFRNESSLPARLNEFAILLTARHMESQFEWSLHSKWAVRDGVSADVVAALPRGGKPAGLQPDEDIVYDFVTELLSTKRVSAAAFTSAKSLLTDQQYSDLVCVVGYYTMVSMEIAAAGTDVPDWQDTVAASRALKS
jgi:4-carboxymuconolactone decarboxylase